MSGNQRLGTSDRPIWRRNSWINKVTSYFQVLLWLERDSLQQFGWRLHVFRVLAVILRGLELVSFVVAIKAVSSGFLNATIIVAVLSMLALSSLASYWVQARLLSFAMDYERSWMARLRASHSAEIAKPSLVTRYSRQMSTILRNLNQVTVSGLLALPVSAALVWLAPVLTLLTAALITIGGIPMFLINRDSARFYNRMTEAQQRAAGHAQSPGAGEDELVPTDRAIEREWQDSYEGMMRMGQKSQLVTNIVGAIVVSVVLALLLQGQISLTNAVLYLVGLRFLLGQIRAIVSGLTAKNRYYSTVLKLKALSESTTVLRSQ